MNKHRYIQSYIVLVFFIMFIYGICNQALGTLISRIIEHYDIRMAQAGLISSFVSAGNFAAFFIITVFSGRISKMILIGAGLLLYAASLFWISAAPPFGVMLVGFSLAGLFAATIDMLNNSLAADLMPDKISRSMSLLHGLFGLGALCGPLVIERLAKNMSWAQVYRTLSLVYCAYMIIYAVFVKWQWSLLTTRITSEKQARFGFSEIAKFFTLKKNVLLWAAMFFYGGNQSVLAIWIKRYVETHLNAPFWGAYALSAMWLGIAISRLVVSPVIRTSSIRKVFIGNLISALVLAAGLLSGSAQGVALASLALGLSSGFTMPLILATCCEWYPEKTAFGTLMPFMSLFIACVVFPPLSGLVSDFLGIPWGVATGAASAFLAAVFSGILDVHLKPKSTRLSN